MPTTGSFEYDGAWPGPVELTGYVVTRTWHDEIGQAVPHVEFRTNAAPWPLVASVGEIAAALHLSRADLAPGTDLDTLAYLVVRTVAAVGWFTVGTLEIGSDDVCARLANGEADIEDHLLHIEMWGTVERQKRCRAAAEALCQHGPQTIRWVPGHGPSPAWGDVTA